MSEIPDEIDFGATQPESIVQRSTTHVSTREQPTMVSFIDHRGRVWTTEITLPENTNMHTVLQIAKASLDLMMGKKKLDFNDLHVLVAPKDNHATTLSEVERVVVMHKTQVEKLEK